MRRRIQNSEFRIQNASRRAEHVAVVFVLLAAAAAFAGTRTDALREQVTRDGAVGGGAVMTAPGGFMVGAIGQITGPRSWASSDTYAYHGIPGPKLSAVAGAPHASFSATPTEGTAPLTVQFTDESTNNGYPILTWDWDFGDNSLHETTQNPVHDYMSPGTYSVTLTVHNEKGSDSYTWNDCITVQDQQLPGSTAVTLALLGAALLSLGCIAARRQHKGIAES